MTGIPILQDDQAELSTYAYSYPHKSSYRPLTPPISIADAWRDEDLRRLSLYIHVPFCEMRCGFCNLFTESQPDNGIVTAYLDALFRQMAVIHEAIPGATFSQLAIGGGTPTFLSAMQLENLLSSVEAVFGQPLATLPTSIETSPATATADRLQVLADYGVQRISLGVQSFSATEARLFGRPQSLDDVHRAIAAIQQTGRFELNLDLMYGHPNQTKDSWRASMRQALEYQPHELYLYPLYVRPETGLARQGVPAIQRRLDLYRDARDWLSAAGYEQRSLRCFQRPRSGTPIAYACQRDGMIGLGCGARSYTRTLHYATRYAVTQAGIRAIVRDWMTQSDHELAFATHGLLLSPDEQLRRYVILSLLQAEGLSHTEFTQQFPTSNLEELSAISDLRARGWLIAIDGRERLTPEGLEHSDEVGPMLYSTSVRDRLREFVA